MELQNRPLCSNTNTEPGHYSSKWLSRLSAATSSLRKSPAQGGRPGVESNLELVWMAESILPGFRDSTNPWLGAREALFEKSLVIVGQQTCGYGRGKQYRPRGQRGQSRRDYCERHSTEVLYMPTSPTSNRPKKRGPSSYARCRRTHCGIQC
jgi:hypothetical protein